MHIDVWQRAWGEISDPDLEGEGDNEFAEADPQMGWFLWT
jgi:hypothetical protein